MTKKKGGKHKRFPRLYELQEVLYPLNCFLHQLLSAIKPDSVLGRAVWLFYFSF